MTLLLQQAFNGIALGSIYALVALGLTLVYGVLRVPNFAHGALYTLGAYLTWTGVSAFGLPWALGAVVAVATLALVAAGLERVAFRPVADSSPVHQMILALGLLFLLEGMVDGLWGPAFRILSPALDGSMSVGGATLSHQRFLVIGTAAVAMTGLHLFLRCTMAGRAVRATAQDREGARLVGIDPGRVATLTFAISGALAAVAGALIAPLVLIFPHMGEAVILKAFVVVVIGGLGSVPGAIACGYLLGLAETLSGTYISFAFAELLSFGLLVLVLAIRPRGFSGGTV